MPLGQPPVGSVITFNGRHRDSWGNKSVTAYSYAAIRANDRWFTTGSTCPRAGYSWKELLEFLSTLSEVKGRRLS